MDKICIAITGGGTGGHLSIAKSIALELNSRGIKNIFIGSTYGQDRMWFDDGEIFEHRYFLQSSGVVNKSGFQKLSALFNILKLSSKCKEIFKTHGVNAVFSVGGYSAAPASFASLISFCNPLFIHEQNAFTGRLNKILSPFAKGFYSSYGKDRFDYPVNLEFFKTSKSRHELKNILFLGGSQGANFINSLAMKLAPKLLDEGISVTHQCGEKAFDEVSKFYRDNALDVKVLGFCKDLYNQMNTADLCVARAGASSLWELCANCLPSIFIPFPHAANNHQFYNAKFLADQNLATICAQKDSSEDKIYSLIKSCPLKTQSEALKGIIKSEATRIIVDDMLKKL